jgi:hypothetical protein
MGIGLRSPAVLCFATSSRKQHGLTIKPFPLTCCFAHKLKSEMWNVMRMALAHDKDEDLCWLQCQKSKNRNTERLMSLTARHMSQSLPELAHTENPQHTLNAAGST